MTIRKKLERQNLFTDTEACVVEYILKNPAIIPEMSIRSLSEATYTSNPTVLRVCRKLGFEGFKEFKQAYLVEMEQDKHRIRQVDASHPFRQYETPNHIVGALQSLYQETVSTTATMLDLRALAKVASDFLKASRVFLFAFGDSQITTKLFMNKLVKLNIHPVLATEMNQELEESYNMQQNDYAVFITYRGLNERFQNCATVLKKRGVRMAVITANEASPMIPFCSNSILVPDTEQTYKIATFHSQISLGFVLNVLYSLIYEKDYEQHSRHKEQLDSASF